MDSELPEDEIEFCRTLKYSDNIDRLEKRKESENMQKITVYNPESLSDCDKLICEVCACTVIYGSEKCFNDEKRKESEK